MLILYRVDTNLIIYWAIDHRNDLLKIPPVITSSHSQEGTHVEHVTLRAQAHPNSFSSELLKVRWLRLKIIKCSQAKSTTIRALSYL
jgi:hypothetical protein